uniref:DUF302 domain-containing protein n=1 Tax=Solibacter usitatus (strain Ellin6076) TaxID=234267 RepID=Q020J8_SOLUE
MSETPGHERQEVVFAGKRIRQFSTLSFDEVLAKLRARVGEATIAGVVGLPGTREEFETRMEEYAGDSGFMLFSQIDHGAWIEKYGIKRRLVRWILGNPLIAITMLQHDYTAGLFVPIELLLAENDGGAGCNIVYVLPSSLIATDAANSRLAAAAMALDAKLEALVASAVAA